LNLSILFVYVYDKALCFSIDRFEVAHVIGEEVLDFGQINSFPSILVKIILCFNLQAIFNNHMGASHVCLIDDLLSSLRDFLVQHYSFLL
jgi:hypothetical protein